MEKEEQFKWQNKQVKPPLINFITAFFFFKKNMQFSFTGENVT